MKKILIYLKQEHPIKMVKPVFVKKCASDYSILYQKINKEKNSEKRKIINDNYRKNNKNKIDDYNCQYRENNKDKINESRIKYKPKRNLNHKEKIKTDNLYKLKCNIRTLISKTFKNKNINKCKKQLKF